MEEKESDGVRKFLAQRQITPKLELNEPGPRARFRSKSPDGFPGAKFACVMKHVAQDFFVFKLIFCEQLKNSSES